MLCGNFSIPIDGQNTILDAAEIQFTHTNFDFSIIKQPDAGGDYGYFNQPSLPDGYGIVYPVDAGKPITIDDRPYVPNTIHHIDVEPMSQAVVRAESANLPSRFVAATVEFGAMQCWKANVRQARSLKTS